MDMHLLCCRIHTISIVMHVSSVCTIATRECISELFLFLKCLRWWHPTVPVHIRTDDGIYSRENLLKKLTNGKYAVPTDSIVFSQGLEEYRPVNRRLMEQTPGKKYRTRHEDFMMEKAVVLHDSINKNGSSLFLDCDIVFLRPLDTLKAEPSSASKFIELSPHLINSRDEAVFGKFNGGWVATNDAAVPKLWEEYTQKSRYFDQAALEEFFNKGDHSVKYTPPQRNFGYWRLVQADSPKRVLSEFSIRKDSEKLIMYQGHPLQSIHSHLMIPEWCGTGAKVFNRLIVKMLEECEESYGFLLDALKERISVD